MKEKRRSEISVLLLNLMSSTAVSISKLTPGKLIFNLDILLSSHTKHGIHAVPIHPPSSSPADATSCRVDSGGWGRRRKGRRVDIGVRSGKRVGGVERGGLGRHDERGDDIDSIEAG